MFSRSFLSFTLEVKCKERTYKFQLCLKIIAFFNLIFFILIFCLLFIPCETNLFNSCVDKLVSLLMNCGLNFREGALFSYVRAGQYVNVCSFNCLRLRHILQEKSLACFICKPRLGLQPRLSTPYYGASLLLNHITSSRPDASLGKFAPWKGVGE